jgi:acyl-CoA thioester hydrolase
MEHTHSKALIVEKPIRINAYDIDVMGIVSNTVYVRWFEDLRFALLDEYFPVEPLLEQNISPILSNTHVAYKQSLIFFDKPIGRAWLSGLGKIKWEVTLEIIVNGKICCKGLQDGAFFDLQRKRPIKTPEKLMEIYQSATGLTSVKL